MSANIELTTTIGTETINVAAANDENSYCAAELYQEMTGLDEDGDEIYEEYVLIGKLRVAEDSRRQGLGRKLLRACMEAIRQTWPDMEIRLAAISDDEDIISQEDLVAFYESEGFWIEEAGDVVIMAA